MKGGCQWAIAWHNFAAIRYEKRQVLRITVPPELNEDEFGRLQVSLLERIKDLTGCPCLSGTLNVVMEERFADILDVELG